MSDVSNIHNIHGFIVETKPNGFRTITWAYSSRELLRITQRYHEIRNAQRSEPTLHSLELWSRGGVLKRKVLLPAVVAAPAG